MKKKTIKAREQVAKMTFKWVNDSIEDCTRQLDIEVFGYDRDADVSGIMEWWMLRERHLEALFEIRGWELDAALEADVLIRMLENAGY